MGLFGLFGKKQRSVDRYEGKPFLRLVDSFVLKCIGELDPLQETLLEQMTPTFQEIYANQGTWEEIVIAQMDFPPDIKTAIQEPWDKNQGIAAENDVTLTSAQFVEMFVTSNIGEL